MLRDLEQVDYAKEARLPRQLRSDIREPDRRNGVHHDLTFFHTVPATDRDVGPSPYAYAAGDSSATNSLAKTLGEGHDQSLQRPVAHSECGRDFVARTNVASCYNCQVGISIEDHINAVSVTWPCGTFRVGRD